MTVPASAPFLFGDWIVIAMVGKSCGSTALVMEKVPLPSYELDQYDQGQL